jgi:quinol monooxygenase YgiN
MSGAFALCQKEKSMAIKVLLEVQLKADSLEAGYAGVHDTLVQTRAFPGAISLEVLIDHTDPARIVVIETWESTEAHDRYTAWRASDEGAPTKLVAVLAGAPVTRTFAEAPQL